MTVADATPILAAVAPARTEPDLQRGRSTVDTLHAHLVFVTKYPRPVFTGEMLTTCEHLTADICAGLGGELREFNGQTDHVHLLVHYPPSLAVSMLVNRLKGVSSRRLPQRHSTQVRKYLWGKHFWSPSYFAASCSGAPLTIIKQYIEQQNRPD
jgi:putative transposase